MTTIPEIKQKAKNLLWIDEDKDCQEVEKIINDCNRNGYDGRLIKNLNISPNGEISLQFLTDHPLFKVSQYFSEKYGDDDWMAFYYRWSWKMGISSGKEE